MKTILKALKGFSISAINTLGKILLAIIISSPITFLAVQEAYVTRGYFAVGGEWMLMIVMSGLIFWIMEGKEVSHE